MRDIQRQLRDIADAALRQRIEVEIVLVDRLLRQKACMVKGSLEGGQLARRSKLSVLFIDREGALLCETRVGRLFETRPGPERVVDPGISTR